MSAARSEREHTHPTEAHLGLRSAQSAHIRLSSALIFAANIALTDASMASGAGALEWLGW
eukprot:COSAG06_NODE_14133_length_1186_cov_0.807728_2_plen_59_part_01